MNKQISNKEINQIYVNYFEIIDSYFGSIKHHLGEDEESHMDLGIKMASYPLVSDLIIDAIDELDNEIDKFWQKNTKTIFKYVQSKNTLKCLYSGDISPVILENFIKRTALYVDTVIIPDPIINLTLFQKQIILDKKYYLQKLIRHVFNVWKLKDLVLADASEKAVIILPINLSLINPEDRNTLISTANSRFTDYTNNLFNQNFDDEQPCMDFLAKNTNSKEIFSLFKNPRILPRKFSSFDSLDKFLVDFGRTGKYAKFRTEETTGWDFGIYLKSQFVRVQEHKFFCDRLKAEPIYDYELPWFFFNYEIGGLDMDAAIINSLQNEKFNWLSNVPLSAIPILRAENKLDYMREILRKGITDLKARNDENLLLVGQQLEKNFIDAFKRQESELNSLSKQVNSIMKKEIPIITGGFLAGFIPYVSNVVSLISAGKDIKSALDHRKTLGERIASLESNFINLLIKSHERKN